MVGEAAIKLQVLCVGTSTRKEHWNENFTWVNPAQDSFLLEPQLGKITTLGWSADESLFKKYSSVNLYDFTPSTAILGTSRITSQADAARAMLRAIPAKAKQIVLAGDFGGADLVQVSSDLHRPSFKDPMKISILVTHSTANKCFTNPSPIHLTYCIGFYFVLAWGMV